MKIRPAGVGLQEVVDYLTEQYTYLDGDVESQATTALLACVKNGTVCVLTNGRYKLVVPSAKNMVSNCITRSSHGPRCCCLRVIRKMLSSFPDTCCTLKEVEHRRHKAQSDAMKRERTRRIKRSVKPKTFLCTNPKKIAREIIEKEEKKKEEKKEEEKKAEEEKKEEGKVESHEHEICVKRERKRRERKEMVKSKKINRHGDSEQKDCNHRAKPENEKCKAAKRKEKSEHDKGKAENGKEKGREKEKRDREAEERKRRTEMRREKILRKKREIRCVHQVLGLDSFLHVEVCSDNCHLIQCPFCLHCHTLPGKSSECTLCQTFGVPRDVFSPRDQSL